MYHSIYSGLYLCPLLEWKFSPKVILYIYVRLFTRQLRDQNFPSLVSLALSAADCLLGLFLHPGLIFPFGFYSFLISLLSWLQPHSSASSVLLSYPIPFTCGYLVTSCDHFHILCSQGFREVIRRKAYPTYWGGHGWSRLYLFGGKTGPLICYPSFRSQNAYEIEVVPKCIS